MRSLVIVILSMLFLSAEVSSSLLNERMTEAIYRAAEKGEPRCQCIMGILFELGEGVQQNIEEASMWYLASAVQGYPIAQKRLGHLNFLRTSNSHETVNIFAAILASYVISEKTRIDYEKLKELIQCNFTESEINKTFEIASDLIHEYFSTFFSKNLRFSNSKQIESKDTVIRILDRWTPAEDNERVYSPGTFEGNVGILKQDYFEIQSQVEGFVSQLNDLKFQITTFKHESIQQKIDLLKQEAAYLKSEAIKDLAIAILEAMAAGIAFEAPPAAILSGWEAINNFKEAAENYIQSIDVKQEIERLMDLEKSLEKTRELERENDRRGK